MGDFVSGQLHSLYQIIIELLTATIVLVGLIGTLTSTLEATLKKFRKLRQFCRELTEQSKIS